MYKMPPPEAVTRVVRWIVLLFLAYALFSGKFHVVPNSHPFHAASGGTSATSDQQQKDKDCATQSNPLDNFAALAGTLTPSAIPFMHIQDITQGTGTPAVCGQHATFHYEYTLTNKTVIFSNYNKDPSNAILGEAGLLRGFEAGMMGMKPGGERKITFPSAFGFDRVSNPASVRDIGELALKNPQLKNSILTGRVSLLSLAPEVPSSSMPLRIIDRKISNGVRAMCGDTVRARITIWKLDGTKVFSTEDANQPVIFTLGLSQAPFGIEQGVTGMTEGTQRTIIIPAAYVKPLQQDMKGELTPRLLAPDIAWPNETLLAEITLEHIGDDATSFSTPAAKNNADLSPKSVEKTPEPVKSHLKKDDDDDDDSDKKP